MIAESHAQHVPVAWSATREIPLLWQRYAHAWAFLFTVLFFSNVLLFTLHRGMSFFPPSRWLFVAIVLTGPIALIGEFRKRSEIRVLLVWGYGYITVAVLWSFLSTNLASATKILSNNVYFVVVILVCLVLYSSPSGFRGARQALVFVTVGSALLNVYEFFTDAGFSNVPGRSAGFYEDSNTSGTALNIGLVLTYPALPPAYRLPYQVLVGVGVFTTLSRGAMIVWVLVVALQLLTSWRQVLSRSSLPALALVALGFTATSLQTMLGERISLLETRGGGYRDRLQFFTGAPSGSNIREDERVAVLRAGWEMLAEHPLLGRGTGMATIQLPSGARLGVHNEYLTVLLQWGIAGALVLAGLLLLLTWQAGRRRNLSLGLLVVLLAVEALFTHELLLQWIFAVAVGYGFCSTWYTGRRRIDPAET